MIENLRRSLMQDQPMTRLNTEKQESGRTQSSLRKWLRRILKGLACLVALLILFVAGYIIVTNYRGKSARERIIQGLEKRGLPTDLSYLEEEPETMTSIAARMSDEDDKGPSLYEQAKDGTRFYLAAFRVADFPEKWT